MSAILHESLAHAVDCVVHTIFTAMVNTLLVASAVLAIGIGWLLARNKRTTIPTNTRIPDGPPGKPLIGNLLDIPPYHSWLKFTEWSKQYGPLYRLNLAGQNHIIVSSEKIANDLLRERGTLYSSRAHLPMATELVSRNMRPLLLPYGETWRTVRKLMHHLTNVSVAATYEPLQEEESLRAVRDLLGGPEKYETVLERYSAGLILRLAYSKAILTGEEPFVRRIMAVVHAVERVASPGAYLVDTFPILMKLPAFMAPFKREGKALHDEEIDLFRTLLKEGVECGEDNFCATWSSSQELYSLSNDQVAYTIGTLFEAGAGTTAAAMRSFILAMTLHPKEFLILQQEVDSVVGSARLPTFADILNLPRVRAIAKEVLRWRPVTAGGLPHMLIKDDVYKMPDGTSVFLEAGTCVHPVQWSIHLDEDLYPDADSFRPERWLEPGWPTFKGPLDKFPNLQNFSAFGFGRRICPGINIAERSLYILISRIAWASDISCQKDALGADVLPPSYDYVTGFNVSIACSSVLLAS
jgi:cytochrome P450